MYSKALLNAVLFKKKNYLSLRQKSNFFSVKQQA